MFELKAAGWSFLAGLELVQADILVRIEGETVIDEPLCVDAGLPSLLASAIRDTQPRRFAEPVEWERTPYFVCGCGDASCRAFVFETKHEGEFIRWIEWEESEFGHARRMDEFLFAASDYRREVLAYAEEFLGFIREHPYRPDLPGHLERIESLAEQLRKLMVNPRN